jgi:hypothetical protein
MKSLFLAWQAPTRAWFPIGRLNADYARSHYIFQYTQGALRAGRQVGFMPLTAFPDIHERYESAELFPVFKNRVLDPTRKDFADYLRSLDLDPTNPDPIEILAISGGQRQTDSLEVFPKIEKNENNTFACRFFLHGLRHVSESAQRRSLELIASDSLQVSLELNNPATGPAIQLTTKDYEFLGWAPRYLVSDLLKAIATSRDVSAHVVRVNEVGVPLNRRVLIELSGRLPAGFEPMSGSDFQPVPRVMSHRRIPRPSKSRMRH